MFQSFYSYSNFEWNSNCNKAYKKILLLEFNTANQIILEEKKENPSNKIVYLLDNYIDFFKIQIGEEKSDYIHNIKQIESRIEHISNGEKSSQWYNYSLAEIYIQTAANRLKFGDYFKAAYDINKAYRLLSSNKEKYPEFIPNNKSFAVLETLLGTIPEKYNWVLSLANMNGSVKYGLNNLDKTIKNMKKNALYNYLIDVAISILENRIQSTNSYPFYYLDFLVGKGKLNNLDLNAKDDFIYYLNHFKGENYIKSSYMYLSWLAIIKGDTNLFHNYQAKINSTGSSLVGSDKEAQNQFSNKVIPNVDLLKARLLYDGGYYNRSLQILKNISFPNNTDEKLEWVYRKAINYEKLGMIDLAEEYFILSYKLGKSKPYYFAAKSAVHLAQIYEKRNNTASANEYFQKCIDLENHEYEQSLEQKAKAGLNRIKISNP